MVVSQSQAEQDLARAQRDERVARAFGEQGNQSRAERLRSRAAVARAPAEARLAQLNPSPALLSGTQIREVGAGADRELLVAQLRAQAAKARELEAQERAQGRLSKYDREDIDRYQVIARESDRIAGELSGISGPVPEGFRLQIARARFPDVKTTELRARYGTEKQQERAKQALRDQRATDAAMEESGFQGTRAEFLAQERAKGAAANQEAAQLQRLRFLASGESKTASPAQVTAARVELERRGVQVFSSLEAGGREYQRGTGAAERPGQVVGIRSVSEQERRMERTRLQAGVQRDNRGNLILVREGARGGETAEVLFKELGAPERRVVGGIEFGREQRTVFKREGFLPELSVSQPGEEVSRRSTIVESIFTVPNAESARVAGFPTEQEGRAIEFPARFKVTSEERTDFPRRTVFTPIEEGLARIDAKGLELAGRERVPLEGVARADFLQKPAGERLRLTVEDFGGRIVQRVQQVGGVLEQGGGALERAGAATLERFPLVTPQEREQVRSLQGTRAQLRAAGSLLVREVSSRAGISTRNVGQFLTEEGRIAQASPVTFGAGEAVLIGSGFGIAGKSIEFARASKLAQKTTVAGRLVRGGAATARAVEVTAGVGLTGAFAVQTAAEVSAAERPGAAFARATNQLAGFLIGARAGARGVEGVRDVKANVQSRVTIYRLEQRLKGQLITRDVTTEIARVSKDLGLEVAVRPVEARVTVRESQERGGLKVEETAKREVLGESRLVRPEEMLRPDDYVLVSSVRRVRQGTLQENIGPQDVVSGTGLPARPSGLRTEEFSGERRAATLQEALPPIDEGVSVVRLKPSDLAPGLRRATQDITIERYDPLQLSGDTRLVPTGKKAGRRSSVRRLGYEPRRIGNLRVEPLQVEALKGYNQATGDFFMIEPKTGEFTLVRQTEFRKFERGTKGIPGRRVVTRGQLPESAETNLNLPRELAREFARTERGIAFLNERGVYRIEAIKKAPKKKPDKRSGEVQALGDEVEVASGGQLLLKKRAARAQGKQEVRTEQRQETKLEQEMVRPEERQKARQDAQESAAGASFTRNRFAGVSAAFKRAGATSALGAALSKNAAGFRLRSAPSLSLSQVSGQELRQVQLLDQRARQEAGQAQVSIAGLSQSAGQRSRSEQRSMQELLREQRTRERARLEQSIVEIPELKIPRAGSLFDLDRPGGVPGFQVLVRRGGRFELASSRVLTRGEAIELGASIVDASPAQTFKLLEAREEAEGAGEPSRSRLNRVLSKFSTKKGDVFRERQANLIDTAGELRDITFKGVRASAQSRRQLGRLGI